MGVFDPLILAFLPPFSEVVVLWSMTRLEFSASDEPDAISDRFPELRTQSSICAGHAGILIDAGIFWHSRRSRLCLQAEAANTSGIWGLKLKPGICVA